jgi:hypothetical protein
MAECVIFKSGSGGSGSDDVTASSSHVLAGHTAITSDSGDEPKGGTIPSKSAEEYNTSGSDQVISSGQYLAGDQTVKGVQTSGIEAGNIKKGVTAQVGDANNTGRIKKVVGTYSTVSNGQNAVTPGAMLPGYSGFANGSGEIKGNMAKKGAETFNTSTSDRTIAADRYLEGDQTIKAVTTSNIDAGNIKKGVVVKVGDENSSGRIKNVTGTYTTVSSGQTALIAGALLPGYSGFANGGGEVKGSMKKKSAEVFNTSTSDRSIAAGQYMEGAQTIKGVTTANIAAGNIKKGVRVQVGDANSAGRIKDVTGTWYGNKKTIGACAWCGRGLGDPNPSETQSFTMPDSGTVYYGGMSSGYYGGSGNCRIYKNNSVVDNRDLGTYLVRGSMFNKSFAANKGDVIKVEATATSGDATVTCIQAVIVY